MNLLATKELRSLASRVQRRLERALYATGRNVECPFCHWTGWRFMSAGRPRRPNRLCPRCGSLERYRMLPLLLERERSHRATSVLELAPKACFTEYCRGRSNWKYVSSDLDSPAAMVHADLRAMPFESNSFDVVVCFHVMEHIKDDGPAFAEIGRMLTPDGLGIICVPVRGEVTQEGAPKSEWERLYGQADHVRYYGMDITSRMQRSGLNVRCVDTHKYFTTTELSRHALRGDDRYLFFVSKPVTS